MRPIANRNRPFGHIIHKSTIKVPFTQIARLSQMEVEWTVLAFNANHSSEYEAFDPH